MGEARALKHEFYTILSPHNILIESGKALAHCVTVKLTENVSCWLDKLSIHKASLTILDYFAIDSTPAITKCLTDD